LVKWLLPSSLIALAHVRKEDINERYSRFLTPVVEISKICDDTTVSKVTVNGMIHGKLKQKCNDRLEIECDYVDGKKHGKEKWWYENDQFETDYIDDRKHGKEKWWYENGQLARECDYVDDRKHGKYKRWHANGQLEIECAQLEMECDYIDDRKHGKYKRWNEDGQLEMECEYVDGIMQVNV
jgi:antitoxin component YwqK of YwqJK toxin-antitoxin module